MPKFERVVHIRGVECVEVSKVSGVEVYQETGYLRPSQGKPQTYVTLKNEVLHAFNSKLVGNGSELEYLRLDEMPEMVRSVRIDGRECIVVSAADDVTTYRDKNNTQILHMVACERVLYTLKLTGRENGSIGTEVTYHIYEPVA